MIKKNLERAERTYQRQKIFLEKIFQGTCWIRICRVSLQK